MKIHIVSLQRSGSKSLYNAIHKAMPDPLMFDNGDQLGEFLHGWSEYGYKFGPGAKKPFDQNYDVVFRTHTNFSAYKGENFTPVECDGENLVWTPTYHKHYFYYSLVKDRLDMLRRSSNNLLVKTQYASLVEEVLPLEADQLEKELFRSNLFTDTIFLVPDDLVKWMCSNYLCDNSGVFVQCRSQEEAAEKFKASPVVIPKDYIHLLSDRFTEHSRIARTYRGTIVFTSDLQDPEITNYLGSPLGLDLEVKEEKEFSAFDYPTMIANYDEVCDAAAKL